MISTAPFVRGVTMIALLVTAASCRSSADAPSSFPDGGSAQPAASASSSPVDALGTIYPRGAPPHPRATRLCDTLHAVPARRKAECCGGVAPDAGAAPFLATECARVLGATLDAGTVELDEAVVDRCAAAMSAAFTGCDWVTPSPPALPEVCQQLLRGKLARGGVCRSSLECAGDMHCEGVGPTKTGICAPPAGEGAGCGAHVDVLATYLSDRHLPTAHPFCAEHCSLVAHRCGPQPEVGSACVANVNCAASQLCVKNRCSAAPAGRAGEVCGDVPCAEGLRCVEGACAARASTGEGCSSDSDCALGACVRGGDGVTRCGPQCSASLDALGSRDGGLTMGLPHRAARPRR
ncbi:MAG TPA: hypothetical protein VK550_26620 [Polyangiaceae bacterium]|nr:hypothetical protein [Polyangiaceae bacterium]